MWEETFYLILRVVVYSKNQDISHWQGLTHRKMEKNIEPRKYPLTGMTNRLLTKVQ